MLALLIVIICVLVNSVTMSCERDYFSFFVLIGI